MPEPAEEWIFAHQAAKLLGLTNNTVYRLVERGDLEAEVTIPAHRPRQYRQIRIRRAAVDEYVERARVRPGELRRLYP